MSSKESVSEIISGIDVVKRNGEVVVFNVSKIKKAVTKAVIAVEGYSSSIDRRNHVAKEVSQFVAQFLETSLPAGGSITVEAIQDKVEEALMGAGEYDIARAYILYRKTHAERRANESGENIVSISTPTGGSYAYSLMDLTSYCYEYCEGIPDVSHELLAAKTWPNLYSGISWDEGVLPSLIMTARFLVESDPGYSKVAARLLNTQLIVEVATTGLQSFTQYIGLGVSEGLLDNRLAEFNLEKLSNAIDESRTKKFDYLGLQTLYDRYFIQLNKVRIELPQWFFMRVAMGLAINEADKESKAIEFYDLLSQFRFMSSTPTLFNSGTVHSQLSSCFLTTVPDDLEGIYDAIKENALLQKYAGGLGNDWTNIRGLGSKIKGTNGESQGVIPFLKVVNDTAVAVNQGGKRRGAVCAYLEPWHIDFEEFLDLRKNTGDERRRTHDMNTAAWIPDLFMQRVMNDEDWTLFSPDSVPDLHDLYGDNFNKAFAAYEAKTHTGEITLFKRMPAVKLWRKMLTMLFETGHPWVTFKDSCNIRSPQQHIGVVHSSNLCTEITLNTSDTETAVCNLGSVNLAEHFVVTDSKWTLDEDKLRATISTAMRMLDNVVDINFYASEKARNANLKHRPVGLGTMAFADCLQLAGIPYNSEEAMDFADKSAEMISYYAYLASTELAKEKGAYESFEGSLWSKDIMPQDSLDELKRQRGEVITSYTSEMDWQLLRDRIKEYGIRNSNCVATAPTATVSNICGVTASIEPVYQNLFVKSNLSGEFVDINKNLVADLKRIGLWDDAMVSDLKYYDGVLAAIDRVPQRIKDVYVTAFEIEPKWLIEAASRRQRWIDQSQSLNLYISKPSGKVLDETYKLAWSKHLKTTYYLRTLGASGAEKLSGVATEVQYCSIDNPECEACQ